MKMVTGAIGAAQEIPQEGAVNRFEHDRREEISNALG